jgi:NTE family protein
MATEPTPTKKRTRARRIGLALAGGGVLAAAHVGVLRALVEAGLEVSVAVGVSAGSLIAALWAMGRRWEEMLTLSDRLSVGLLDWNLPALVLPWRRHSRPGLLKGRRLERVLESLLPLEDLAAFPRAVGVVAADLLSGRPVVFANRPASGRLGRRRPAFQWHVGGQTTKVLLGSMAVPVLFPPVPYRDHLLVDGGVVDHVPAWAARALGADFVIGVDLSSWTTLQPDEASFSPLGVGTRALSLMLRSSAVGEAADLVIAPSFPSGSRILDVRRIRAHYEAGYAAAEAALPLLRARLHGLELA